MHLSGANPPLPHDTESTRESEGRYQSDAASQAWEEYVARALVNHWVAAIGKLASAAERFEKLVNIGGQIMEARLGFVLQEPLSRGPAAWGYGGLLWYADPDLVEFEETNDKERWRAQRALVGWPVAVEPLDPLTDSWLPGKTESDISVFVRVKTVEYLEYSESLAGGRPGIIMRLKDKKVLAGERDELYKAEVVPDWVDTEVTVEEWGEKIELAWVWTKHRLYELARSEGDWTLIKSNPNGWGRVPVTLAFAMDTGDKDLAYRWKPILGGLYTTLPEYNRTMEIHRRTSEAIMLGQIMFRHQQTGALLMDRPGQPKMVTSMEAAAGMEIPEGYEPVDFEREMNAAWIDNVKRATEEMMRSVPRVGVTETTGTTQAWTAAQLQSEASAKISPYLNSQARALKTFWESLRHWMMTPAEEGGYGEGIYIYHKEEGKDALSLIGVEPEEVADLGIIDITIAPESPAQKINQNQIGMQLQAQGIIDELQLRRDYMREESPLQEIQDKLVRSLTAEFAIPRYKRLMAAAVAGDISFGGGKFFGEGGEQIPGQVVAAGGGEPAGNALRLPPPMPPMPANPPSPPPLQAPGAEPIIAGAMM